MKIVLSLIFFYLIPLHSAERISSQIEDFSCGLVLGESFDLGLALSKFGPGCSQDARNVYFSKRKGSVIAREQSKKSLNVTVNATSGTIRNIVNFPTYLSGALNSGVLWVASELDISRCIGNAPMACTNIESVFNSSHTSIRSHAVLDSLVYVGGGRTPLAVSSVDSARTAINPPADISSATLVGSFRDRLLLAGSTGTLSSLYLSGEENIFDWALGSQSTSPAILSIDGVDNTKKITALAGEDGDGYLIGKMDSIWKLYGFDLDDFEVRKIIDGIGIVCGDCYARSKDGTIIFLARDGFYMKRGNDITYISEKIRDLAERIATQAIRGTNTRPENRQFAAIFNKDAFWFSYVVSGNNTFTENSSILVYELKTNSWTQFTGINASSFAHYGSPCLIQQSLVWGNSNGDGQIYSFGYQGDDANACGSNFSDAEESAFEASFELVPYDMGDFSSIKNFERLYVVANATPSARYAPYDPMEIGVRYTIDGTFLESNLEVFVTSITNTSLPPMKMAKVNLSQSGQLTASKGRWISFKFISNSQRNPFLVEAINIEAVKLGKY